MQDLQAVYTVGLRDNKTIIAQVIDGDHTDLAVVCSGHAALCLVGDASDPEVMQTAHRITAALSATEGFNTLALQSGTVQRLVELLEAGLGGNLESRREELRVAVRQLKGVVN